MEIEYNSLKTQIELAEQGQSNIGNDENLRKTLHDLQEEKLKLVDLLEIQKEKLVELDRVYNDKVIEDNSKQIAYYEN